MRRRSSTTANGALRQGYMYTQRSAKQCVHAHLSAPKRCFLRIGTQKNMRGRAINARRHTKDTRRRACFANRHTFIAPRHTPFCAPTHICWRPNHIFTCFVARDAYRLAALTRLTPLFITPSVCLCFGRFRGGRRGRAAQEKRAKRRRSEIHVFMGLGRPWASWFGLAALGAQATDKHRDRTIDAYGRLSPTPKEFKPADAPVLATAPRRRLSRKTPAAARFA